MMAKTNDTRVRVPATILDDEATSSCGETYDIATLNPSGRVPIDSGGICKKPKFLKCKKTVDIGTLNTKTLRNL